MFVLWIINILIVKIGGAGLLYSLFWTVAKTINSNVLFTEIIQKKRDHELSIVYLLHPLTSTMTCMGIIEVLGALFGIPGGL